MMNDKSIIAARHKVGQYLKSIRKDRKLTYYAVAKLAGLSIKQVQSIEAGNKAYTIDSFLKIAHALNADFLVGGNRMDFGDMADW